jgi:NodT family efflux transporter outer membrane factor (OMF) lipoprotein
MNHPARLQNPKHVLVLAIICSLVLVLPGCCIPPLRPAQPGPGLPATFNGNTNPANSAQFSIAEFFNDPVLTCLIEQGLANNRELKILTEEAQIAQNEILARQGAWLPFLRLAASAGIEKFSRYTPLGAAEEQLEYLPGKHFPAVPGNFLLAFNFRWNLDIWRELRNARDAATKRYHAALDRRNYFAIRLVADIAENYYQLMALDLRLENVNNIITLQQQSLKIAEAKLEAARTTAFPVRRFEAEIRRNQSQKWIIHQQIIETENRINFLLNRLPQPIARSSARFFDQEFPLCVGVPVQLMQNRPDIRGAERELEAAGLDVKSARARFFPQVELAGPVGPLGPAGIVGVQAFDPKYLFSPGSLIANFAGDLVAPLLNKAAIRADYLSANARQLQSVYDYQRTILEAFTEVINRINAVQNYGQSVTLKKQQVEKLKTAVEAAIKLYQAARIEYIDILFAQRDLWDARLELIDTRMDQLASIVHVYQALGGGLIVSVPAQPPHAWLLPPSTAQPPHAGLLPPVAAQQPQAGLLPPVAPPPQAEPPGPGKNEKR